MPIAKIGEDVVQLIGELTNQGKGPSEVARIVNVKPAQVSAILASRKLRSDKLSNAIAELERAEAGVREVGAIEVPSAVQREPQEDQNHDLEVSAPRKEDQSEETEDTTSPDQLYVGDDREHGDPLYWEPTNANS